MDDVELIFYAGVGRKGTILTDYGPQKLLFFDAITDALEDLPKNAKFISTSYGQTYAAFIAEAGYVFFLVGNESLAKKKAFSLLQQVQQSFEDVRNEQFGNGRAMSARLPMGDYQLEKLMLPRFQEILWFIRGKLAPRRKLEVYRDAPGAYLVRPPESPTESRDTHFKYHAEEEEDGTLAKTEVEKRPSKEGARLSARELLMSDLADMLSDLEPIKSVPLKPFKSSLDLDLGTSVTSNRRAGLGDSGNFDMKTGVGFGTREAAVSNDRFRDFWSRSFAKGEFARHERMSDMNLIDGGNTGSFCEEKSPAYPGSVNSSGTRSKLRGYASSEPSPAKESRRDNFLGRLKNGISGGAGMSSPLQPVNEPLESFRSTRNFGKGGAKVDAEDLTDHEGTSEEGARSARGRRKLRAGSIFAGRFEEAGGWTYESFMNLERILRRKPPLRPGKRMNASASTK